MIFINNMFILTCTGTGFFLLGVVVIIAFAFIIYKVVQEIQINNEVKREKLQHIEDLKKEYSREPNINKADKVSISSNLSTVDKEIANQFVAFINLVLLLKYYNEMISFYVNKINIRNELGYESDDSDNKLEEFKQLANNTKHKIAIRCLKSIYIEAFQSENKSSLDTIYNIFNEKPNNNYYSSFLSNYYSYSFKTKNCWICIIYPVIVIINSNHVNVLPVTSWHTTVQEGQSHKYVMYDESLSIYDIIKWDYVNKNKDGSPSKRLMYSDYYKEIYYYLAQISISIGNIFTYRFEATHKKTTDNVNLITNYFAQFRTRLNDFYYLQFNEELQNKTKDKMFFIDKKHTNFIENSTLNNLKFYYINQKTDKYSSIKEIGMGNFNNCPNLLEIQGQGIVRVGKDCFDKCDSLTTINLPDIKQFSSTFPSNVVNLFLGPNLNRIKGKFNKLQTLECSLSTILNSVKSMSITSINDIESLYVEKQSKDKFAPENNLEYPEITIICDKNLTDTQIDNLQNTFWIEIKKYIKHIVIKKGFKNLLPKLFSDCFKLESVDMSESDIINIPEDCFSCCTSLKEVVLNNNLNELSKDSSILNIEPFAFYCCTSLKKFGFWPDGCMVVDDRITLGRFCFSPSGLEPRNLGELETCIIYKNKLTEDEVDLLCSINFKYLDFRCDSIDGFDFMKLASIKSLISIKIASQDINKNFNSCSEPIKIGNKLKYIALPYSCYVLKAKKNSSLEEVVYPSTKNTIDNSILENCKNLSKVTIYKDFLNKNNIINKYTNIKFEYLDEEKIDKLTLNYPLDFNDNINSNDVCEIIIDDKVTSLPKGVFSNYFNLQKVTIGNKLHKLPTSAFENCINLTEIINSSNILSVGNKCFKNCQKLIYFDLNPECSCLGSEAFESCYSLLKIALPYNVDTIRSATFKSCENLKEITIPGSILSIGKQAFEYCDNLETINGMDNIASIELNAFKNCISLKKLIFPSSLKRFDSPITDCLNLSTLIFTNDMEYLSQNIIMCPSLTQIVVPPIVQKFELFFNDKSIGYDNKQYKHSSDMIAQVKFITMRGANWKQGHKFNFEYMTKEVYYTFIEKILLEYGYNVPFRDTKQNMLYSSVKDHNLNEESTSDMLKLLDDNNKKYETLESIVNKNISDENSQEQLNEHNFTRLSEKENISYNIKPISISKLKFSFKEDKDNECIKILNYEKINSVNFNVKISLDNLNFNELIVTFVNSKGKVIVNNSLSFVELFTKNTNGSKYDELCFNFELTEKYDRGYLLIYADDILINNLLFVKEYEISKELEFNKCSNSFNVDTSIKPSNNSNKRANFSTQVVSNTKINSNTEVIEKKKYKTSNINFIITNFNYINDIEDRSIIFLSDNKIVSNIFNVIFNLNKSLYNCLLITFVDEKGHEIVNKGMVLNLENKSVKDINLNFELLSEVEDGNCFLVIYHDSPDDENMIFVKKYFIERLFQIDDEFGLF